MDTKELETFPFWIGYPFLAVFGFFLIACLWACGVHILAKFYAPRVPYRRIPGYLSTAFWTVCASIVFGVFFSMIFVRFHAVTIGADHIELVYCWPRPNLSLAADSLQSASIHRYRNKGCRLEIATDQSHFRSVDSDELDVAKQIKAAVESITTMPNTALKPTGTAP